MHTISSYERTMNALFYQKIFEFKDLNYFYNLCSYKYDLKFNFSHREADKPYLRVVKILDYYTFLWCRNLSFKNKTYDP